jgi:multidrug efflux pump subunit AcrB
MNTEQIKEKLRNFGLTDLAVDNGTSIFILAFMILIFGLRSYSAMPKESYPEASLPTIFINTPYFGNSAADIESLIARPLEKELNTISGIKNLNSTSIQDFSVILVEFDADEDQDAALSKVKDAVDKAKGELPNDLDQEPDIKEIIFSEFPIMTVNVSGNYGMDELRTIAEDVQDKIESLKSVNKVDLKGALDREVKINVDLIKMQALQVSFNDIEAAIANENLSLSAGELIANDFRRSIRILGEFKDVSEIQNIIVKSENQRPIYLKDFGSVEYGFEERTSYARSNSLPVISLDVIKRRGGNVIDIAETVKQLVEDEKQNLPSDVNLAIFNDQSQATKESVATLENSIISGVILVVLVLLFFLGLRNALFVGISIPLSMLMGILFLDITGTSLNMVVLFGLILALGLLVDNAIVVVENVYRYMQQGYSGWKAAKYGAGEVALPIMASTATTLAAFIPLALWPGIMGQFMVYLPITLIAVLSSSLFVALVINPVFASRLMQVDQGSLDNSQWRRKTRNVLIGVLIMIVIAIAGHFTGIMWVRNLFGIIAIVSVINHFLFRPSAVWLQGKGLPFLERQYDRFIQTVLRGPGPYITFLGSIGLFIGSIFLFTKFMPDVEYFPVGEPIYANVFVDLPLGSDIEATNEIVKKVEEDVKTAIEPYQEIVEEVLTQIGEETSDPNSPPEPGLTPHKARITVSFVSYQDRDGMSSAEAMEAIRDGIEEVPGVNFVIDQNSDGPPVGLPINLEVIGENLDELSEVSQNIVDHINRNKIAGIEGLKRDVRLAKPELEVSIDREAARRFNLSTVQIALALRTSVYGKEVSKYKVGEDEYPIMLRLNEDYRYDVNALMNQKITFRNQSNGRIAQVPISSVVNYKYTTSYNAIKRKDQKRVITIYSNVLQGYNANAIVTDVKDLMSDYDLPPGISIEFTGEQEQQAEDSEFLMGAFILALFTIFIILVAQFNSIYSPFIIILSIVFSTIGVFLGYVVTGRTIGVVFTGVGIISLAGIVVNNAIVLIDYINLLVQRKRESIGVNSILDLTSDDVKQAIVSGGSTRLRPVLLTAITTVLGLIPLAIGFNINFFTIISDLDPQYYLGGDTTALWGSLAWTVIYGLVFSTFLTLVIVPAMYFLAYKLKYKTEGYFYFKKSKPLAIEQR